MPSSAHLFFPPQKPKMNEPVSSPTVTAASCGRHELARRDRAEQTRRRHRRQSRRRESSHSISDADLYSDSSLSGDDLMQRLISRSSSADDVSSSDISSIVPLSPSSSSSNSVSTKKKTDGYAADSDDENKNDDELKTKNIINNNIDNIPSLDFAPPKLSPNSRYANRYKLQKPSARKKSSLRRSRRRTSATMSSSTRSVSSIRSVESLKTYLKAQRVAFAETVEMFEHSAAGSTVISHISQMSQTTIDTWESLPGTRQQRRITIAVLLLVGRLAYCLCAAGSSKASSCNTMPWRSGVAQQQPRQRPSHTQSSSDATICRPHRSVPHQQLVGCYLI